MPTRNTPFPRFIAVFVIAAAVRLSLVGYMYASHSPAHLSYASGEIVSIAINIAAGRGFSSPFGPGNTPTAWVCPLIPYIYAAIITIARDARAAFYLLAITQSIVGAFAAATYWLIARKISVQYPGKFRSWLLPVVAVVVSVWPESVYSAVNPWYFVWQEAALAVFILAAMRWWDKPTMQRCLLAGLVAGTVALINVTPLPIIAFAIFYPVFTHRGQRQIVMQAFLCCATIILIISPQLIRNAIVFHAFVPLRAISGCCLYEGNNDRECIREPDFARIPGLDPAEMQRYVQLGEIRYCRDAYGLAFAYIRQHPLQTAVRTIKRIYVSWFTDLTDHWLPQSEPRWYTEGWRTIVRYLLYALLTLTAVGVLLWSVLTGRFRSLPYAPLFAAILLLLPLPHFFTFADNAYTAVLRMWVAVTAVLLLAHRPTTI